MKHLNLSAFLEVKNYIFGSAAAIITNTSLIAKHF
jgi:hypothetical protein